MAKKQNNEIIEEILENQVEAEPVKEVEEQPKKKLFQPSKERGTRLS